ncbi:MAG: LUD domain-containing protein, partial [Nanoarchaeota archaeon]
TSVTLETLGIAEEIAKSGKYNDVRKKFERMMADKKQKREMKKIGAAPEYAIGSVHAITQNGEILIASGTGSQLPAYAYGSDKVIFVVGTQKIVKNLDEGIRRIYEHSLPLESERAKKAYGVPGSSVNKILIINKEVSPSRIHILFVNRVLGF